MAYVTCEVCHACFNDEYRWCLCPHNRLEAAVDAPRGTNKGYCQEHDLFGCMFDHEEEK